MAKSRKNMERWENPECPATFERECFPPLGISRLLPHHFVWWARPPVLECCCCCCGSRPHAAPAPHACSIDLQLEANTFGPGRSIHILVVGAPYQYFAEFYLTWTATSSSAVTVDLELISGPGPAPRLLADDRGPSDRYLFSSNQPGRYLFRATATNSQGDTCFDTLEVNLPGI